MISKKIAIAHNRVKTLVTVAMIMLVAGSIAVVVLSMILMVTVLVTELLVGIGCVNKVVEEVGVVILALVLDVVAVGFV